MVCEFYWGGHGCDLADGHEGLIHRCGDGDDDECSEYNAETGEARYALYDCAHTEDCACQAEWSEWMPNGRGWTWSELEEQPMSDPTQHWAGPQVRSAIVIFETDDGVSHQCVLTPTSWQRVEVTMDEEVEYVMPTDDLPPLLAAPEVRYTHTITLTGGQLRGQIRKPTATVVQQVPQPIEEKP